MRALIYLRVSTEGQSRKENSIPTQREACLNHAQKLCYEVVEKEDIYIDAGESGRTGKRRSFQEMLERLEHDKYVDAVIAYDTSRIFRNGVEFFLFKNHLLKMGKKFLSVTEPIGEEDSPSNYIMEWMLAGIAEFRSRQDGEKIRTSMRHKAEMGILPGRAPFGYKNVRGDEYGGREKRWIEVDEIEAMWVKKIFDMFASGKYSIETLTEELVSQGFPTRRGRELHKSSLSDILKNKIYIGYIDWGGIQNKNGKQEKIIDEDIFWKVQSILDSHLYIQERRRKHSFPLRGFVFCDECNSRINAAYHKGKMGKVYAYYSCQKRKNSKKVECFQEAIQCNKLEDNFFKVLLLVQLSNKLRDEIKNKILTILQEDRESNNKMVSVLQAQRQAINRKKTSLVEKYVDEKIDETTYNSFKIKFEKEERLCDEDILKAERSIAKIEKLIDVAMSFLVNCSEAYMNASPENRKVLCNAIFERIGVSNGEITSVILKHPQAFILKKKVSKNPLFQQQYKGGPLHSRLEPFH